MRRTAKTRDLPHLPPVEKIEVDDTNRKRRLIVAALFLALGAVAIAYGFFLLVAGEKGWREVDAVTSDLSCAGDFTLYYNVSSAAENRSLSALYGQAAQTAFRLFTADTVYEDSYNVASLSRHPNEPLEVDPALYNAFSLLQQSGRREPFLAPAARLFDDITLVGGDYLAAQLDPWENSGQAAYFAQIAAYARDPQSVNLELLGNDRVCLRVSEEYRRFAEENGIEVFFDFGWMKNAFITDYLAQTLLEQGYTGGVLASYDGYSRSLSPEGVSYSLAIFHREGDSVRQAAALAYEGPTAAVSLRDYALTEGDALRFYRYENGARRTPYLSLDDGRCYAAVDTLTAYSRPLSCAELLLELIPVYVRDSLDPAALPALRQTGLEALWCEGDTLWYTDPALAQGGLTLDEAGPYTARQAS